MTQLALYEMPKKECRRVAISVPIPKWLPPSLALWLRQRMAERPEGKLTVATRFSKGAVSYTHLTLPTILRV